MAELTQINITQDEAALLLNRMFATKMRINPLEGAEGMLEYSTPASNPNAEAEFGLYKKALTAFGLKAGFESSYQKMKTYQAPLSELDMPALAEKVNFPGRDQFLTQKLG